MAIDQHEFWSNLAADIGDILVLEFDDVLLESLVLILADFAILDLTRSVARLSESIDDLLSADESVAGATGWRGMDCRDGVRVYEFSFECWDDDVHLVWFGLVVGRGDRTLANLKLKRIIVVVITLADCETLTAN